MQIIENTLIGTTQNNSIDVDYSHIDDGNLKAKMNHNDTMF